MLHLQVRLVGPTRAFFLAAPCPQVPRLRAEAIQRVLRALADAYATVHAAIEDPASGYQAAEVAQAVRHSPAQVATLLGVGQ